MEKRFAPDALERFVAALFAAAGLDDAKSAVVAHYLVEGDMLGHTTHGVALAPAYLKELQAGRMAETGEPRIISDRGACVAWDGRRLPGVWLLADAIRLAVQRAPIYGTVTVAISSSHHIACLAAYLMDATSRGFMIAIASSDPANATVAPFGGRQALFSPDPIAVGIPTNGDPILIDTSCSITTNGMTQRLANEGRTYEHDWLLDAAGNPTKDPKALFAGGSILPAGGVDHGHKGYGWALIVEALTQGLSGYGRADRPSLWGASVFVQVIDPSAFSGSAAFTRQTGWLAEACTSNPPRPGFSTVRVPGHAALARRRDALTRGVALYPGVVETLLDAAGRLGCESLRA